MMEMKFRKQSPDKPGVWLVTTGFHIDEDRHQELHPPSVNAVEVFDDGTGTLWIVGIDAKSGFPSRSVHPSGAPAYRILDLAWHLSDEGWEALQWFGPVSLELVSEEV